MCACVSFFVPQIAIGFGVALIDVDKGSPWLGVLLLHEAEADQQNGFHPRFIPAPKSPKVLSPLLCSFIMC